MRSSDGSLVTVQFARLMLLLLAAVLPGRASGSETPVQVTVKTSRHAWYRGEEVTFVVDCRNRSPGPVDHARLRVALDGTLATASIDIGSIAAGNTWTGSFRLATNAIRTGNTRRTKPPRGPP